MLKIPEFSLFFPLALGSHAVSNIVVHVLEFVQDLSKNSVVFFVLRFHLFAELLIFGNHFLVFLPRLLKENDVIVRYHSAIFIKLF